MTDSGSVSARSSYSPWARPLCSRPVRRCWPMSVKFSAPIPKTTSWWKAIPIRQGSADYNLELSRLRAERVRDALLKDGGFDPKRFTVVGYGQTHPIADNATAERPGAKPPRGSRDFEIRGQMINGCRLSTFILLQSLIGDGPLAAANRHSIAPVTPPAAAGPERSRGDQPGGFLQRAENRRRCV